MAIKVKMPDGQEGELDLVAALQGEFPNHVIKNLDVKTGKATLESSEDFTEIDVGPYLRDSGLQILDISEINSPETAVDSSPLTAIDRAKLGLMSRESAELSRLAGAVAQIETGKELDAKAEQNQSRALGVLKKKFDDARIVSGEYVVKQNGVWHKADASGLDRGDIMQFAAANGLNILGSIAGGAVGTLAGPAGTAAGGVAGSALAEAGEEFLATAIEGGSIDVTGATYDVLTDGIMGLVGNAAGKVTMKAGGYIGKAGSAALNKASAYTPDAVKQAVKEASKQTVDGFANLASIADSKVKDMVSNIYGSVGPDVSVPVMRQVIDSPENVKIAANVSAKVAGSEKGKADVLEAMTETFQNAFNKVKKTNQDKFGKVVGSIINKADDRIELDLDVAKKEVEAIIENAAPQNRNFLNPVISMMDEMRNKITPKKGTGVLLDASGNVISDGAPKAVLRGKDAVLFTQKLKAVAAERLEKLGAHRKAVANTTTDPFTLNAAFDIENLFDSKIMQAADTLELSDALKVAKSQYGETKEYMKAFWTKSFSETSDIDNVQKILKGKLSNTTETAITRLDELHPEAKFKQAINSARVLQGGIEMQPIFKAPKSQIGTGVVITTALSALQGNIIPLSLSVPAISPRASYLLSRNMTSSGGVAQGIGAATGMTKQAAEVSAKQLMRLSQSAGFLNTLGRAEAYELLKSPARFEQMKSIVNGLVGSAPEDTEEAVMDAAAQGAGLKDAKGER